MKKIVATALMLAAASPAAAAVILFDDRASFAEATRARSVESFGELTQLPVTRGRLNSTSVTPNGTSLGILPGVTYSTAIGAGTGLFFNIDLAAVFRAGS